jgi:molybdopterin-binding protein
MKISARNQLKGKITEIEKEGLIAKVRIAVDTAGIHSILSSLLQAHFSQSSFSMLLLIT